jgi:NTP pyrophosphatase (non-canonical NTP hydrolase)
MLSVECGLCDKDLSRDGNFVTDYGTANEEIIKFARAIAALSQPVAGVEGWEAKFDEWLNQGPSAPTNGDIVRHDRIDVELLHHLAQFMYTASPAPAAPQEAKTFTGDDWENAQRICDLPSVDETIRNLLEDQTNDNAVCMVREILSHAAPAPQAQVSDELIKDLEFAVALAGKLYPERAEQISLRLKNYRLLSRSDDARDADKPLTFAEFRRANVARCLKWHPAGIGSWSPSDWLTAVTGELGELASLLKMRNRERDGLPGNKFSPTQKQIADELADVLTYLDLLAEVLGVDLATAAVKKFNEVSERVGFPDRL